MAWTRVGANGRGGKKWLESVHMSKWVNRISYELGNGREIGVMDYLRFGDWAIERIEFPLTGGEKNMEEHAPLGVKR